MKCAVLTVGGWFDAEDLQGPFTLFHAIERDDPGIFNALVVGPWVHGGWARYEGNRLGRVSFAANTGDYYRKNIIFPFFEQYLKDKGDAKLPKAYVFETGTNEWRQYSSWPPKNTQTKKLYFTRKVSVVDPPKDEAAPYDEYISDPNKPVPFINYVAQAVPQEYMLSDQRFADFAHRCPHLSDRCPAGRCDHCRAGFSEAFCLHHRHRFGFGRKTDRRLSAGLSAEQTRRASSRRKRQARTDVSQPPFSMAGYQQLVRGEPFRGKFRHSFEKPEPFTPGNSKKSISPCRT